MSPPTSPFSVAAAPQPQLHNVPRQCSRPPPIIRPNSSLPLEILYMIPTMKGLEALDLEVMGSRMGVSSTKRNDDPGGFGGTGRKRLSEPRGAREVRFPFDLPVYLAIKHRKYRRGLRNESNSMTQGNRHNCAAVLTTFIGDLFLSPLILPTPIALIATSRSTSDCACRALITIYHFIDIFMLHSTQLRRNRRTN